MQAVPAALAMTTDTYGIADAFAGMLQLLHGNGLQHSHVQLGAGERWGGTGKYQRPPEDAPGAVSCSEVGWRGSGWRGRIRTFNPLIQRHRNARLPRSYTVPIASTRASTGVPKRASMASAASLDVGEMWL